MRAEPSDSVGVNRTTLRTGPAAWAVVAVVLAAATGLGLLADTLGKSSATYDEVAYLRVASVWWRTGDQESITRMGSPLTYWKLQQVPVLWLLDHSGRSDWVDDPIAHQSQLLPLVRSWGLTIWLLAFGLTVLWSWQLHGPLAMILAAWIFALSPNLLAHGSLATMELPLVASTTGMFFLFWRFLRHGDRRAFWGTAALGGLAWSCKFTTVLVPPILGLTWALELWRAGERGSVRVAWQVTRGMTGFLLVMFATNLALTGFAILPMSTTRGQGHPLLDGRFSPAWNRWIELAIETPLPQDWIGFATQIFIQRSGGSSYLWGETRHTGWWYYYFVTLGVKVPLSFGLLALGRLAWRRWKTSQAGDLLIPISFALFLTLTAIASSRNYGLRYLLPLSPLAIVWISALAEGGLAARRVAALGVLGQAIAVASCHPHELTYFNALAGGPAGGRHILADSNLDWGQGLRGLARLQRERPEFANLTLYYFGDTEPRYYGVVGQCYVVDAHDEHPDLPPALAAETAYVGVSTSLQWGPWGPRGYFRSLDAVRPVATTDDHTIAIYRAGDCPHLETGLITSR